MNDSGPKAPSRWSNYGVVRRARAVWEIVSAALLSLGWWLLSLIATLGLPCLPLAIEWVRTGDLRPESINLTAAVMASAFIFSTEHVLYLCLYVLLFFVGLLLNVATGPQTPAALHGLNGYVLGAVGILHMGERLWWHVVLDRPFPDRLSKFFPKRG